MRFAPFPILLLAALATTVPAHADDRADCLAGIDRLRAQISARPTGQEAEDLRRTLRRAEREVREGEFDECAELVKADDGDDKGTDTGSIFGFTEGTDVEDRGTKEVSKEVEGTVGKRVGRYRAGTASTSFSFAPAEGLNVEIGATGSRYSIRNVPGMENRSVSGVSGLSAEIKWRVVKRGPAAPVGVTFVAQPGFSFLNGSGERGRGEGLETRLAFDTALVPDKVFGAVNLIYEAERFRPRGSLLINGEGEELEGRPSGLCGFGGATDPETCIAAIRRAPAERESRIGVSGAVAFRVVPSVFLGGDLRYLRAYEGLALGDYQGHALFLGPTVYAKLTEHLSLSAAWSTQVAGRSQETPGRALDLDNFTRHRMRVKISYEF